MADWPVSGPRRWLVVMAKEPRAGAVKTRLARQIGTSAATAFHRQTLKSVSVRLAADPRWHTLLAVTPDQCVGSPVWPATCDVIPQGSGDLGARMQRLFDSLPPGPAIIVGTDIPEVTGARIADAFRALGRNDAVVGPATDGGYWLIGLKRAPGVRRLFEKVRWSSPHTLADTLENLEGMSVATLETLSDVDDAAAHRRLGLAAGRVVLPACFRGRAKG